MGRGGGGGGVDGGGMTYRSFADFRVCQFPVFSDMTAYYSTACGQTAVPLLRDLERHCYLCCFLFVNLLVSMCVAIWIRL